jgi:hypothetical protein
MRMPFLLALVFWLGCISPAHGQVPQEEPPRPGRFALVFSFGYGGDLMPKDDAAFDKLLGEIKKAGFNTIHCTYTEKRLDRCRKHDMQMMVDLLADEHHVYKSPEKAKAVCEKLKGDAAVWGYNVWNDVYRKTTPGRIRDLESVRAWDPTHPAYTGTYRTDGMRGLTNPDIFGYYDFHWKRGLDQHFPHLLAYHGWAKEKDAWFYSWLAVGSGIPGKGNFNRSLWSANTAIACGQKGILWFLATDLINKDTLAWTETGNDIARVNRTIAPLAAELTQFGNPVAIYSTTVTKTPNNDPLAGDPKERLPVGLEKNAFPASCWIQPVRGEFLAGQFRHPEKRQAAYAYVANHNAYAEQDVALRLMNLKKASRFDRATGQWETLKAEGDLVAFRLPPAGAELLRFEK